MGLYLTKGQNEASGDWLIGEEGACNKEGKTKPEHTGRSVLLLLGYDVAVWGIAAVTLLQIAPFIWALWVVCSSGHRCLLAML